MRNGTLLFSISQRLGQVCNRAEDSSAVVFAPVQELKLKLREVESQIIGRWLFHLKIQLVDADFVLRYSGFLISWEFEQKRANAGISLPTPCKLIPLPS